MAALKARSLLTGETILSPDALHPTGVGGIIRMVGGLRLERWAPSPQNGGRHQIGSGGRLTLESAGRRPGPPKRRQGAAKLFWAHSLNHVRCLPFGVHCSDP